MSAPLTEDGSFDRCNIYDVDYTQGMTRPDEETPVRACTAWEYDESRIQVQNTTIWFLFEKLQLYYLPC